jgi:hypothetical protein
MPDDAPRLEPTIPALPPGYVILNDGPGREVLARDDWELCPVFPTVEEATAWAWEHANDREA